MKTPRLEDFRRIVVKVGSSLLVDATAGRLNESWLASLIADPEVRARMEEGEPLGRLGTPEDLVGIAVFLASDAAANITGQTFGAEGNHLFTYRMMTSHGSKKRTSNELWTIDEIGQLLPQIMHW